MIRKKSHLRIAKRMIFFVVLLLFFSVGLRVALAATDDYIANFVWGTKLKDIPDWEYPIAKGKYAFLFLDKKCTISYNIKDGIGDGETGEKEIVSFTISFDTIDKNKNVLFGDVKRYLLKNYKIDRVLHELLSEPKILKLEDTIVFYSNKFVILSSHNDSIDICIKPIQDDTKNIDTSSIDTYTNDAISEMYASELCRKSYLVSKQKFDMFLDSIDIDKSDTSDKIIWSRFFDIPNEFAQKNDCQNGAVVVSASYKKYIYGDTNTIKQVNSKIDREFNKSNTPNPALLSGKIEDAEAQNIWAQMKKTYTPFPQN